MSTMQHTDTAPSPEAPTSRRRAPVRATVLPHAAHVSAWVRETATERAHDQMFTDFNRMPEETSP